MISASPALLNAAAALNHVNFYPHTSMGPIVFLLIGALGAVAGIVLSAYM